MSFVCVKNWSSDFTDDVLGHLWIGSEEDQGAVKLDVRVVLTNRKHRRCLGD